MLRARSQSEGFSRSQVHRKGTAWRGAAPFFSSLRSPIVRLGFLGARIRISAEGHTQFNHVGTACGYASSSAGPVHFGLGPAKMVDEIEIRWPSGTTHVLKDVQADRILRVKEPC